MANLESRLNQLKKTNVDIERREIPDEMSRGWWRITDPEQLVQVERNLHLRGAREQILMENLKRSLDFLHDHHVLLPGEKPPKVKPLGEDLNLEALDEVDDIQILDCGVPAPDVSGQWSWEVALRVDKYILEQVEALEDKVCSASMQIPVSQDVAQYSETFTGRINAQKKPLMRDFLVFLG